MTKEEILEYCLPESGFEELEEYDDVLDNIYEAMDEYAMNENISFIKWVIMEHTYYSTIFGPGGAWRHNTTGIYQMPHELHKLFLKNRIDK